MYTPKTKTIFIWIQQTHPVLKTELKPQVAQPSIAVPVKVKDEPMDEEYEKASATLENIKDEPDTAAVSFTSDFLPFIYFF